MKGNAKLVEALNDILAAELAGIHQYFVHAKLCATWGYAKLAERAKKESLEEMHHADALIERILFLEGIPNVQRLAKVKIGETVPEQFKLDLALEIDAVSLLNKTIALASEVRDHGTRELLEGILRSEEDHVEWLETQLRLLKQLGEPVYLAEQIS